MKWLICFRLQFEGFKACFGGEELKRACATLSGALIGGKLPVRLAVAVELRCKPL